MSAADAPPVLEIPEVALLGVLGGPAPLRESVLARFAAEERFDAATGDLFARVRARLAAQRLSVVDLTGLSQQAQTRLVTAAKAEHTLRRALLLDVPDEGGGRPPGPKKLKERGYRQVLRLGSAPAAQALRVVRRPLANDRRELTGPFDLVGDVHGCARELRALLERLDYAPDADGVHRHPADRTLVFLGDLVDRGPAVAEVLELAMPMVDAGAALCLRGNHEAKLLRWLEGKEVKPTHGTAESVAALEARAPEFRERLHRFIDGLPYHLRLDGGRLVVAHAGLPEALHGRESGAVRSFALYGDTTGERDAFGLPVRRDWAADYRGEATVVYGHTPTREARWVHGTICLDTACVFGGALTALRYPERELVSVPAGATHFPPSRPPP